MKIAALEDDKQTLMTELGRMREQYTHFNSQLDSVKKELKHSLVSYMYMCVCVCVCVCVIYSNFFSKGNHNIYV